MSNTELCKYYLNLNAQAQMMPEVAYFDIIPALNAHFNNQWTWELADERFACDNTNVCTTVTVYIPGRILTGRAYCKIKDYGNSHLYAILNACESFIQKNTQQQNNPQSNQTANQQMSMEQIMAATNGQSTPPAGQPVNSSAQFYNYKDAQNMPAEGVPFDQITENCHNELQQEMGMNTPQENPMPSQNNSQTQQPQMNNVDYDAPNPKLKGFSQHQVDRMNKFKTDFEITNDNMFGNYINTWDSHLSSKNDITPQNVNAFLQWADDLGKTGC